MRVYEAGSAAGQQKNKYLPPLGASRLIRNIISSEAKKLGQNDNVGSRESEFDTIAATARWHRTKQLDRLK